MVSCQWSVAKCGALNRHVPVRQPSAKGFSLGSYLILVDYTGRLFRDGKAAISAELSGILERLGSSAETWRARLEKLNRTYTFSARSTNVLPPQAIPACSCTMVNVPGEPALAGEPNRSTT